MGAITIVGRAVLVTLAIAGYATLLKLASDDGLWDLIGQNVHAKHPVIPGTKHPLQTHWTGYEFVDAQIGLVISFFAPIFQGYHPQLSLTTLHFYGCLVSIWTMVLVESYRVGNVWRPISFAMVWGLLVENVGMALILPTWCVLHLSLSPTVGTSQTPVVKRRTLLVHPTELKVIPWSVALGLGIPSAAILYCDPAVLRPYYLSQQFWIVMRQINPIFVSLVHLILSFVIPTSDTTFGSPAQRNSQILHGLRRVYRFATFIAVISHVILCTISIGSIWQPSIFNSKLISLFNPITLYKPVHIVDPQKVKTIAEGAWRFIQWDEIITSASGLVWAITLNREALATEPNGSSLPTMLWNVAKYTVLGGPAAAVIALMRERDEVLLGRVEDEEKKDQ